MPSKENSLAWGCLTLGAVPLTRNKSAIGLRIPANGPRCLPRDIKKTSRIFAHL
jgi:hypothetical protein